MKRYNIEKGVMVESPEGEYVSAKLAILEIKRLRELYKEMHARGKHFAVYSWKLEDEIESLENTLYGFRNKGDN